MHVFTLVKSPTGLCLIGISASALLAAAAVAPASSSYRSRVPNGSVFSCRTCHNGSEGSEDNVGDFGNDFLDNGSKWSASLANKDSDGDGAKNGVELLDPNGTWVKGQANPGSSGNVRNPNSSSSVPPTASPTPSPIALPHFHPNTVALALPHRRPHARRNLRAVPLHRQQRRLDLRQPRGLRALHRRTRCGEPIAAHLDHQQHQRLRPPTVARVPHRTNLSRRHRRDRWRHRDQLALPRHLPRQEQPRQQRRRSRHQAPVELGKLRTGRCDSHQLGPQTATFRREPLPRPTASTSASRPPRMDSHSPSTSLTLIPAIPPPPASTSRTSPSRP